MARRPGGRAGGEAVNTTSLIFLGATLLNKSVGKGSAKFKGAAAASAAPGAAADSKGVL